MENNVSQFREGSLWVSRALFRCDLQRASSHEIPLAVLAELMTTGVHVFGMVVRANLTDEEINLLPSSWQEDLRRPEIFFESKFQGAWEAAKTDHAIPYLAERHFASLLIEPPAREELSDWLRKCDEDDLPDDAIGDVLTRLRAEARDFLKPPVWFGFEEELEAA